MDYKTGDILSIPMLGLMVVTDPILPKEGYMNYYGKPLFYMEKLFSQTPNKWILYDKRDNARLATDEEIIDRMASLMNNHEIDEGNVQVSFYEKEEAMSLCSKDGEDWIYLNRKAILELAELLQKEVNL